MFYNASQVSLFQAKGQWGRSTKEQAQDEHSLVKKITRLYSPRTRFYNHPH